MRHQIENCDTRVYSCTTTATYAMDNSLLHPNIGNEL